MVKLGKRPRPGVRRYHKARPPQDRTTPIYLAWDPDNGSEADAKRYGALDVACAARIYAERVYTHDGDYWCPPVVMVRDPDGKLFRVAIKMDMEPVFRASEPVEVAS